VATTWTIYHLGAGQPLYIYLCPPGGARDPVGFCLAGLGADQLTRLRVLRPGDAVPEDLVNALHYFAVPGTGPDTSRTGRGGGASSGPAPGRAI
jgi:hypothetical protein